MKCRPLRHGDQMQCPCGLAWDVDEEKPQCRNAVQIVEQVELFVHSQSGFGLCKDCNENLEGDGYKIVLHCPNANESDYEFNCPDDGPVYCEFDHES